MTRHFIASLYKSKLRQIEQKQKGLSFYANWQNKHIEYKDSEHNFFTNNVI